jgi:hypothetical protein
MSRCIAYTRSPISRNAWNPCRRRAADGSHFCRRHDDAVDGAILGLVLQSIAKAMRKNRTAAVQTRGQGSPRTANREVPNDEEA